MSLGTAFFAFLHTESTGFDAETNLGEMYQWYILVLKGKKNSELIWVV